MLTPNAAGVYYPMTSGALGPLVSLNTGDVLDLSRLSGLLSTNTIRIYGDATIIGGGPENTITNLMIETYGGSLTVSNLFLSSVTNIINNVNGSLTLVVLGTNCFQSTLVETYDSYGYGDYGFNNPLGAVIGAQGGGNITFTGPGALVVTTSSTNFPAVLTAEVIIANGASNLTFSSQSPNSVSAAMIFIINSEVTSHVGIENDNEFVAGTITLGNSVLDMSYGIINPNIISPCTWLGKIRGKSQFTVQQTHAGIGDFHDGIFVKLVGTTGTSEFMNINSAQEYNVENNGTAMFNMSYSIASTGTGDFQGLGKLLSIQIYKQDDIWFTWELESADIAPNVSGDVASTYNVTVNNFWFNTTATNSFSVVETNNPFGYTINPDNKTVTIDRYPGPGGAVIIPSSIHGYPVTGIATGVFEQQSSLGSVTIPSSVTNIAYMAFWDCLGLREIYFQGSPPSLGSDVFTYDNKATVYFSPETTGWGATYGGLPTALWVPFTCTTNSNNATVTITGYTGLGGAVIIPNMINGYPVTSIADNAFENNTTLTSVTIPGSVTNIGQWAFGSCFSLMGIYFQGNPPSLGEDVFNDDELATVYYLPTPGTTIWGATFGGLPTALWEPFTYATNSDNATVTITGYTGPGGTVTVPGTINGLPVTGIGTNAFTSNVFVSALQITNVLIPNTVTNLGDGAFQMCCNLAGVYFQGNPPSLGTNVFTGDDMATAYFLPATTGWGATFGGLPTASWLTINGGTDGGDYSNLQQVTITANNPTPTNGLMAPLVQWTGATQYVANVNAANTTVNLPAQPVALTAMFAVAPVITTQPASQAVNSGSNATFSVTVYGPSPLTYQWYFNDSALTGATDTNYTLTGVTAINAGSYTVVVTNLYGSVTSSVAALTVEIPPSITTQPASQVAAVGVTVSLSVTPDGTAPLSFQWFKNGGMLLGATNSALVLANASVTDSGVYYVVITNAYGMNISQPASVTVGTPQLLAWGYNSYGQLGDGTIINKDSPESVASNVVAVVVGGDQSLYLKSDATLWAVGYNGDGELGDGTMISKDSPESVASNVVAVAAGAWHSLYLKSDGTLWAVGQNDYGQLGDGTTTSRSLAEPRGQQCGGGGGGNRSFPVFEERRHIVGDGPKQLRPVG